ncbi:hypothetical protein [Thalassospira mesophila]|uniref:MotA/TolQ/ExbB proton channel domain-containing protein n=1 Tax=Thalassospira mesophila TaxID=1293891 RepID=A0A1Y2KUZ9_9PROT|nr:hypothetical protein [Thalassospira mesophila]OSQ35492.1 hypothetical protein TMES_20960 [Thalassospira mesophila]
MNLINQAMAAGAKTGEIILYIANWIVADYWPGLLSLIFFTAAAVLGIWIGYKSRSFITAYKNAIISVDKAASGHKNLDLSSLEEKLNSQKTRPAHRLANAFKEFRETLLEIGSGDETTVKNAIRPSAFLNADELGFSLRFYRIYPPLFVSVGLFFTFLGLVAVLSSTADILPHGQTTDQTATMNALRILLGKASAKFTISLSGLLCSILLNFWLKLCVHKIEDQADAFTVKLEEKMDFISLEGLAEKQLRAVEDQTLDMKDLITTMTAELSAPLKQVTESSIKNIDNMVGKLGENITSGLGGALEKFCTRIEEASNALDTMGTSLQQAAQQFDTTLKASTQTLDTSVQRLEQVSTQLTTAGKAVGEATPSLLETIKETNNHSLKIAEGSVSMVNAAKTTITEEKEIVTETMNALRDLIRSFESRAAAYDGQLEKAFKTYQDEVAKTIDRLERHGSGVQDRFVEALGVLQTVIENAKSFEPESIAKSTNEGEPNEVET